MFCFSLAAFNRLTEFSFTVMFSPSRGIILQEDDRRVELGPFFYPLLLSLSITYVFLSASAALQLLSVIDTCFIQPDPQRDSCQTPPRERKERKIKQTCSEEREQNEMSRKREALTGRTGFHQMTQSLFYLKKMKMMKMRCFWVFTSAAVQEILLQAWWTETRNTRPPSDDDDEDDDDV